MPFQLDVLLCTEDVCWISRSKGTRVRLPGPGFMWQQGEKGGGRGGRGRTVMGRDTGQA